MSCLVCTRGQRCNRKGQHDSSEAIFRCFLGGSGGYCSMCGEVRRRDFGKDVLFLFRICLRVRPTAGTASSCCLLGSILSTRNEKQNVSKNDKVTLSYRALQISGCMADFVYEKQERTVSNPGTKTTRSADALPHPCPPSCYSFSRLLMGESLACGDQKPGTVHYSSPSYSRQ